MPAIIFLTLMACAAGIVTVIWIYLDNRIPTKFYEIDSAQLIRALKGGK